MPWIGRIMSKDLFTSMVLKPDRILRMRDGTACESPVEARKSRLYPGHFSLISGNRAKAELPLSASAVSEEEIDQELCRFCRPDSLCDEAPEERQSIWVKEKEFVLAKTPYYYLPGHGILFPKTAPHLLKDTTVKDWSLMIEAGRQAAGGCKELRFGFNAGAYLCSGGSQRHLHLQLVPYKGLLPAEEMLCASVPEGASYTRLYDSFLEKQLVLEQAPEKCAFLAVPWAPRFNLELVAVFSRVRRFNEMNPIETHVLASWIHRAAERFVVPAGGGINGFGLETPDLPFMVRIIPRLPGAVQAFMEIGAGCMIISHAPETTKRIWQRK